MSNTIVGRKVKLSVGKGSGIHKYDGDEGIIASVGDTRLQFPITVVFPMGYSWGVAASEIKYLNNRPVVLP